jgi:membrane-associated phospholipid phosphatase
MADQAVDEVGPGSIRGLIRSRMPGGVLPECALVLAFVALTVALAARTPVLLRIDLGVADWCDQHRPYVARLVAGGFNLLGQGGPQSIIVALLAAVRARRLRSIRPLIPVVAAYLILGCIVMPLKILSERAAPHAALAHREWLFALESGRSYPSGHVANALVWYVVMLIVVGDLFPRWVRLLLRIVPAPVVFGTTVYLGYHWVSDDLAGLCIGALVVRILLRVRWDMIPLGRLGNP